MSKRCRLINLSSHHERFVTVSQLASYWQVTARQIYKQIDAGTLEAIRLGPRLFRIRIDVAIDFEHDANMTPPPSTAAPAPAHLNT